MEKKGIFKEKGKNGRKKKGKKVNGREYKEMEKMRGRRKESKVNR